MFINNIYTHILIYFCIYYKLTLFSEIIVHIVSELWYMYLRETHTPTKPHSDCVPVIHTTTTISQKTSHTKLESWTVKISAFPPMVVVSRWLATCWILFQTSTQRPPYDTTTYVRLSGNSDYQEDRENEEWVNLCSRDSDRPNLHTSYSLHLNN